MTDPKGDQATLCPECEGTGEVLDAPQNALDGRAYWDKCPECGGTGKTNSKPDPKVDPAALAEQLLQCRDHNCDGEHHECHDCGGDGFVEADCGEDTCCCADPSDDHGFEQCGTCNGEGGWPCPLK